MPKIVGVRFKDIGKIYYFSPNNIDFEVGDEIVEIEKRPAIYYNTGERRKAKGSGAAQRPVWKKVECEQDTQPQVCEIINEAKR